MFLLKWYREFKQIREEFRREPICVSCESLKQQVEILQHNNNQLLSALTNKPVGEPRVNTDNLQPLRPYRIPWKQQRQMLEAEDRHRAELLKKKHEEMNPLPIKTVASTTLEELEKEVGVVDESVGDRNGRQEERETNTSAAYS